MRQKRVVRFVFAVAFLGLLASVSLAEPPWRFIVFGDTQDNSTAVNTIILGELVTEIMNNDVDFVLVAGDLVSGSGNSSELQDQLILWRDTMQPVYNAGIGVYVIRGNHDTGSVTVWNNVFTGSYGMPGNGPAGEVNMTYSVAHKNAFIVGLDLYNGVGDNVNYHRVNQGWLDSQLAANTRAHVFVFGHEAAFRVNADTILDIYATERNQFWSSIENAGGRTYFCGHDHSYDHARVDDDGDLHNDVHQFVVGTGGGVLHFDWLYNGNNGGYTLENINHIIQYGYAIVEINCLHVTVTHMGRTTPGTYIADDEWSYTVEPVLSGDVNGNGVVGLDDLAVISNLWLEDHR